MYSNIIYHITIKMYIGKKLLNNKQSQKPLCFYIINIPQVGKKNDIGEWVSNYSQMEIHSNILEYKINTIKYQKTRIYNFPRKKITEVKWEGNNNYFYSFIKLQIHVHCEWYLSMVWWFEWVWPSQTHIFVNLIPSCQSVQEGLGTRLFGGVTRGARWDFKGQSLVHSSLLSS